MKIKETRHLLTYQCNLRCNHCYLSAGEFPDSPNSKSRPEFTQEQFDKFYSHFKPEVVSATGGEPLLRKDLVRKLAIATNKYGGSLELVTNGFFLTPELVRELKELNPRTFFQISLDGPREYHNQLRQNPQAYDQAIQAIKYAAESGSLTKVRLTATDDNFSQIPKVISDLDALEKDNIKLVIRPVVPTGRAEKNHLQILRAFKDLDKFQKIARVIKVETTDNIGRCGCGVDTVAINPSGEIFPCTYFVHRPEYQMGKITDDPNKLSEHQEFANYNGTCYARHIKK